MRLRAARDASGAYSAAGGWSDVAAARGLIVALTGIVILFAPQVAFVAGMLGAARGYRLRRAPDVAAGELALVQRRMRVAVIAASGHARGACSCTWSRSGA